MTITQVVTWDPVTEEDKEIKEAFTTLNASHDKVLVQTPNGKSKHFILNPKSYFDLQTYVLTGKDFPTTNEAFEKKMPKKAFEKLTHIDSTIYEKTKETTVAVGSICTEYHNNELAKLVTAAIAAINYSDSTVELLQETETINLKHQLNILLDPKYQTQADQDAVYLEAKEGAQMTLAELRDQAKEKEAEVQRIVERLITFKDNTAKYRPGIQYLIKQWSEGPAENSANQTTPYLKALNADLESTFNTFKKTMALCDKKYSEWETATGIAVGTAFLGVVGWIVMSIKAAEAVELRKAWSELNSQVDAMKKNREEELEVFSTVGRLITQCNGFDTKMQAAIDAMAGLATLFNEHASCYDRIASHLAGLKSHTDATLLANRKAYITTNIVKTIEKLMELKAVAKEFTQSVNSHDVELVEAQFRLKNAENRFAKEDRGAIAQAQTEHVERGRGGGGLFFQF